MKKIVDGKLYNTETAEEVCDISPAGFSTGDFNWEDTRLYRSPKGTYFIAGEGGANSRWSQHLGSNGRTGGSGVALVTEEMARGLVEQHASAQVFTRFFGEPEEG